MNNYDNENNDEKDKSADLDYWEGLSEEDKIKELNMFTEQRRQESIAKYGRDIYAENRTVGNKKAVQRRDRIDKIIHIINAIKPFFIAGILIFILISIWSGVASTYANS